MPDLQSDMLSDEQLMHAMSVDDAYRIERILSSGARGVTELVTIEGSGPFVRKKIKSSKARRGVWAALSECRSLYLPRVWATYEMPDEYVVVCDYVPGESLGNYVGRVGALPLDVAISLAANVCDAANELHCHGAIHRDISPSNVIVSSDGAHLVDLDIARLKGDAASDGGEALGTWGFAAPEQYGFARTDERSDVYSIGRLLGFMLTGDMPQGEGFSGTFFDERVIPRNLRAVIERACAFEPSARYQRAEQLAAALEAVRQASDSSACPSEGSKIASDGVLAGMSCQKESIGQDSPSDSQGVGRYRKRGAAVAALVVGLAAVLACAAIAATFFFGGGFESSDNYVHYPDGAVSDADTPLAANGASSVEADSGADSHETAGGTAEDPVLAVAESGWSVDDLGYVHYAFSLRNENDDFAVLYPQVALTGRSSDGTVLFSDAQTLSKLLPGQTIFFSGVTGNGNRPDTVEFTPLAPEEWNMERANGEGWSFSFPGSVNAVPDGFGGFSFTGEVACESDTGIPPEASMAAVSIVLRDGVGKIVWGDTVFVDLPEKGSTVPFSLIAYGIPAYRTIEAHAQPW